jgi:hypothetical protein
MAMPVQAQDEIEWILKEKKEVQSWVNAKRRHSGVRETTSAFLSFSPNPIGLGQALLVSV